jgi:murein DD-endopeptidase MepM/ murein hydrolase activator NlpD
MTPEGKYINPKTNRSLLQHLRVAGRPLYEQQDGDWLPTLPVTSGFGPRSAPTAGASTFHNGIDYGIAARAPLEWTGGGQ